MTIRLTEDVVNALGIIVAAQFAGELAAVDTERGDGITLAAPALANRYSYPKTPIQGPAAHLEMFEDGPVVFENSATDHQDLRAAYSVPMTVRCTWFNRDGDDEDTMYKRARRYASAITTMFAKNTKAGFVRLIRSTTVAMQHETEGEGDDKVLKGVVTCGLVVDCEEYA